jgi:hypothetical protein
MKNFLVAAQKPLDIVDKCLASSLDSSGILSRTSTASEHVDVMTLSVTPSC